MNKIKHLIRRIFIILGLCKNRSFQQVSYSQEGEDLLLERFWGIIPSKGFFIDVGAHHPMRFSNTYKFYQNGWSGINIDPTPGCMKPFLQLRPKDINLEIGISDCKKNIEFYCFTEPALNTFDGKMAEVYQKSGWTLIDKKTITVRPLGEVLDEYMRGTEIDLMNVDVEGQEISVLSSMNWGKYKPKIIIIEIHECLKIHEVLLSPVTKYLTDKGYNMRSRLCHSAIFIQNGFSFSEIETK